MHLGWRWRHRRRWLGGLACGLTVSLGPIVSIVGASMGTQGAGASTTGPTTPAVPVCGVSNPSGAVANGLETPATYLSAPAAVSPTTLYAPGAKGLYYDSANGYLYLKTGASIVVLSPSGSVAHTFTIPTATTGGQPLQEGNSNSSLIVGPDGSVYFFMMQSYRYELVHLSAAGGQEWDLALNGTPNGLFAWHDRSGDWAAAVVSRQPGPSVLVSPSGAPSGGTVPVAGVGNNEWVSATAGGGLVYDDGDYIHQLGANGLPSVAPGTVPEFGSPGGPSTPAAPGAPFSFYTAGGVVEVGSTIYVADSGASDEGHGLDMFTATGVYEGDASSSALRNLVPWSPLAYDSANGELIFEGSGGVAAVTTTAVQALVRSASPPTQDGFGDALGIGAGLSSGATANYFPSGSTPSVTATFDPWWAKYPDPLRLQYWAAGAAPVTANALPTPTSVPLSWSATPAGSALSLPLSVPASPGVYLVNADLVDTATSSTIGSTCFTYSVGMPGDSLDFATLAAGEGYGGPGPLRGVQLASELGTGTMREQVDLAQLLPGCVPSAPTAAACGPSALTNWSAYDPATEQAAAEARTLGVGFEVEVGQEAKVDEALVSAGYWQQDVQAIMQHFATSAPDLAYVEAWNEPNTGPYTPASYVATILKPFYQAVQTADATDGKSLEVIGGTVCDMDVKGWWTGIAQAGGFAYMDIAGIHPYPGYNRSFEEEGTPAAIQTLKTLLSSYGHAQMPIWDTEQAWWSDGEEAFYDVGDWAPREWMWLRSLGISDWDYFTDEGGFDGFGTDYSLIEATNADDYVKPGAVGLMTVSNLLGGRPFLRQVNLGLPHAYGMLFGPAANGQSGDDVLALWTDDLDLPARVSLSAGTGPVDIATTSAMGDPSTLVVPSAGSAALQLSGAPVYLDVPPGDALAVSAAEAYGPDLASASSGAVATASSSQGGLNVPAVAMQGTSDAGDGQALSASTAWASAPTDPAPWLQVTLPHAETVDRVIVATSSLGSVVPGLRDYSISVEQGQAWTTVGTVTDEFFNRMEEVSFPPVVASAVRVTVSALDYGSQVGGLPPSFWSPSMPDYAVVYSLEVYAPGTLGAASLIMPRT